MERIPWLRQRSAPLVSSLGTVPKPLSPGGTKVHLWQFPFWIVYLYWTFIPTTLSPRIDIADVPLDPRDISIVALGLLYPLMFVLVRRQRSRDPWHHRMPWAAAAISAYGVLSISWSRLSSQQAVGMAWTMVVFSAQVGGAYALVKGLRCNEAKAFIARANLVLAAACLAYGVESLFSLGLRAARGVIIHSNFGIERLAGPLFAPATGGFLLIPALAFALQELRASGRRSITAVFCTASLAVGILLLGSRAALLEAGLFAALAAVSGSIQKRLRTLLALGVIGVVAWGFVFSFANTERISDFRDESRTAFYRDAWNIVAGRDLFENLSGSGYGSVWPWYLLMAYRSAGINAQVATEYNVLSNATQTFHPHSVPLVFGLEMGVVGLAYITYLGYTIQATRRCRANLTWAYGICASGIAILFDLFLVSNGRISFLWWVSLFALLRSNAEERARWCAAKPFSSDFNKSSHV